MRNENLKLKEGFTLLELMVVIAIISIMSVTVVVSFSGLSEKIKLQEIAGVIMDSIKRYELEVFEKNYDKNRVIFESQNLVIESEKKENPLKLKYMGIGVNGCKENEIALEIDPKTNNPLNVAQLIKSDGKGNNLEIKSYTEVTNECIKFQNAIETEWSFELLNSSLNSKTIRLIHFNIDRSKKDDAIKLKGNEGYQLEISSPYGEKTFYKNGDIVDQKIEFSVVNSEGTEENLVLKK